MGLFLSRVASVFSSLQEKRILMLGLDSAGKTTLLYKMLHFDEDVSSTPPTVGFNVERVVYKKMNMTIWDMSDQANRLWRHYYADTDAAIFVVDASDHERLEEARDVMYNVLADPSIHGCYTVLIFLNKQDKPGAASPSRMFEKLELDSAKADPLKRRHWHIQACCAKTGEGVHKGLEWLNDALSKEKEEARPTTS